MSNRNKKGKIHSLLGHQFDITFFHKPSTEDPMRDVNDRFYVIVLEDTIYIRAKLINNAVFVIFDIKSLTSSMTNKKYMELIDVFTSCETLTVLAGILGCCPEFIQACNSRDIPTVEYPQLLEYPDKFYNKYKTYCHNDISRCGLFLLALDEKSFKEAIAPPKQVIVEAPAFNQIPLRDVIISSEPAVDEHQQELSDGSWMSPELAVVVNMVKDTLESISFIGNGNILITSNEDTLPNTLCYNVTITNTKGEPIRLDIQYIFGANSKDIFITPVTFIDMTYTGYFAQLIHDLCDSLTNEVKLFGVSITFDNVAHGSAIWDVCDNLNPNRYAHSEWSMSLQRYNYKLIPSTN